MAEEAATLDLVGLLRQWLDAWNRYDFDAGMSVYAHDAVFTSHGIGAFEGQAAIRVFNEDWLASFEGMTGKFEEVRDLGNGVTFAVIVLDSRPLGSSVDVRLRFASVAEWANGLIVRTRNYTDIDEARAAAERLAGEPVDG
jgi:ketosteroid isomerase-like protein